MDAPTTQLAEEILFFLSGVDDLGLWEAYGYACDLFPENSEAERRKTAADVLHDLRAAGLISFYCEAPTESRELNDEEVASILQEVSWAQRPPSRTDIWITVTDKGRTEALWRVEKRKTF